MSLLNSEIRVTSVNTISAIILKELRLERRLHQAVLAERVNKTNSAWSKIENGKANIDISTLYKCASALGLSALDILNIIDRHAQFLSNNGFQILLNSEIETDDLRDIADEYYKSQGHKLLAKQMTYFQGVTVQGSPYWNLEFKLVCLDVIRCCVDSEFFEIMKNKDLAVRPSVPTAFSGLSTASIF